MHNSSTAAGRTEPYTGRVTPDGGWQQRGDGGVLIRKRSVSSMDNNVYVVACERTRDAVIIDVADRPDLIRQMTRDLAVRAALQTHGHWDHVRAWDAVRDTQGIEIWGHRDDRELFPRPLDRSLRHGDKLTVGDLQIDVVHIPGHTDGSLLYLVAGEHRPHLFSGDTLFPGGHGRTTTREDHERIMDGLEALFDRLPDDTHVYPGHGDDTTIGLERPHLPEWRERGW